MGGSASAQEAEPHVSDMRAPRCACRQHRICGI